MKKSFLVWQVVGFIFTGIVGVILHFLFDWTNQSVFVAPFSAVNESIFEHLKLLFFPMFLFALIESRYIGMKHENLWCVKLIGIVLGVIFIPVFYYTVKGIFGVIPDWVNISIFFLAAALTYIIETRLLKENENCKSPRKALFLLCRIALTMVVLTFVPPHIPLFQDPITKNYGYSILT